MPDEPRATYDKELIRERLKFATVLRKEFGVELRRAGSGLECRCPIHEERTPSFSIKGGEQGDSGHCFGCGWAGDIFKLYMASRGCTFPEAVEQLAGLAGVYGSMAPVEWKHRSVKPVVEAEGKRKRTKPPLPALKRLKQEDIEALAALRGLSIGGIKVAAESFRRVAICDWPQWLSDRTGQWRSANDASRSWVITDETRWLAQYRRLNGEPYELKRKGETEVRTTKAWTAGSPVWPIGAAEMGRRVRILLVEGGADLLAAYHFLHGYGLLGEVAVCAMLGSGNRITEDALPFFEGKRVRIMMDADEPKAMDGKSPKAASLEAAARWQRQLTTAGAAVESFSLYGLETATGARVKDLNDLALCDAETLGSRDIEEAFFEWDF
jgi:hypothetical protein